MGRELRGQAYQLRAGGKTASWSRDGLVFSRCSGSARGGVCTPGTAEPTGHPGKPLRAGLPLHKPPPHPQPRLSELGKPIPKSECFWEDEGGCIPRDHENTAHPRVRGMQDPNPQEQE